MPGEPLRPSRSRRRASAAERGQTSASRLDDEGARFDPASGAKYQVIEEPRLVDSAEIEPSSTSRPPSAPGPLSPTAKFQRRRRPRLAHLERLDSCRWRGGGRGPSSHERERREGAGGRRPASQELGGRRRWQSSKDVAQPITLNSVVVARADARPRPASDQQRTTSRWPAAAAQCDALAFLLLWSRHVAGRYSRLLDVPGSRASNRAAAWLLGRHDRLGVLVAGLDLLQP